MSPTKFKLLLTSTIILLALHSQGTLTTFANRQQRLVEALTASLNYRCTNLHLKSYAMQQLKLRVPALSY